MRCKPPLARCQALARGITLTVAPQKGTLTVFNGNITINGINDKQLRTLLTVKIAHEGSLVFSPNQLQPVSAQQQYPGQPQPTSNQPQTYNNAVVLWHSEAGLHAVKQLLNELTEKEE